MTAFEIGGIGCAAGDPVDAIFPATLVKRLALFRHHHAQDERDFGAAGAVAARIGRASRGLGDVFRRLDFFAELEGTQLFVFLLDRTDADAAVFLYLVDESAHHGEILFGEFRTQYGSG